MPFSFTDDIRVFDNVSYIDGGKQLIDSIILTITEGSTSTDAINLKVDVPRVTPTPLQTRIQGDIDAALRKFLTNSINVAALSTDRDQEATVSQFRDSELKNREYDIVWRASKLQMCIDGYPKLPGFEAATNKRDFCAGKQNEIYKETDQKVADIFENKFK